MKPTLITLTLMSLIAGCGRTSAPAAEPGPASSSGGESLGAAFDGPSLEPVSNDDYATHSELQRVELADGVVARTLRPSMSSEDDSRQDYVLLIDVEGHTYELASLGTHETDCAGFERGFDPEIEARDLDGDGSAELVVRVEEHLFDYGDPPECTGRTGYAHRLMACSVDAGVPRCWLDVELDRLLEQAPHDFMEECRGYEATTIEDTRSEQSEDEMLAAIGRCLGQGRCNQELSWVDPGTGSGGCS